MASGGNSLIDIGRYEFDFLGLRDFIDHVPIGSAYPKYPTRTKPKVDPMFSC